MKIFVWVIGLVIVTISAAFGQNVQTCSQAFEFEKQRCGTVVICRKTQEESLANCLKTGTWERMYPAGQKAGPDIPNLRKE